MHLRVSLPLIKFNWTFGCVHFEVWYDGVDPHDCRSNSTTRKLLLSPLSAASHNGTRETDRGEHRFGVISVRTRAASAIYRMEVKIMNL